MLLLVFMLMRSCSEYSFWTCLLAAASAVKLLERITNKLWELRILEEQDASVLKVSLSVRRATVVASRCTRNTAKCEILPD